MASSSPLPIFFFLAFLLFTLSSFDSAAALSPEYSPSPAPLRPGYSPSPASIFLPPSPSPALSIPESPAPVMPPPSPAPSPAADDRDPEDAPSPSPAPASDGANPSLPLAPIADQSSAEADMKAVEKGSSEGMSGGKKAGVAIGVIAAGAVVALGAIVCKKKQRNIRRSQYAYSAQRNIL